ncbi:BppU family phage baseplate upper protein [Lactococcus lactis]|uniref:BppU family phage baseplate upper protein n=1 Tax=Lactococcus lactis TaxID=1358 RepID=UPI00288F7D6D|nr:BppU family phage baseplate upper protein [Lactococcus lactis]MDT2909148.1 BppU family phage baseplate upper protein [Lactococcus lactis]MDT2925073.1 BppU family phage baseplate upper protein [Lactococcus lactis]MDT2951860.1 BppU family phage baseplate upper protein [Lactococcus lactis]
MSDYSVTLSTTEPNNYVGLIKLRQGDVASQSIQATITANGQLFKFDRLSVFFNAVLPNGNVVRDKVTEVDYVNSKLNYIVADSFLQEVTQVTAWFSFENDEKIIDSTKNFQYSVIAGWKECIPQGNYIYELSEIQREIEEIIGNKDFSSLLNKIGLLETDISYLNNTKANKAEVDAMLSSIAQGGPRELFYSLAALKAKYPNGEEGTYLVFDSSNTDGAHSYMWDKSVMAWKDLGVYQGLGLNAELEDLRTSVDGRKYTTVGLGVKEPIRNNSLEIANIKNQLSVINGNVNCEWSIGVIDDTTHLPNLSISSIKIHSEKIYIGDNGQLTVSLPADTNCKAYFYQNTTYVAESGFFLGSAKIDTKYDANYVILMVGYSNNTLIDSANAIDFFRKNVSVTINKIQPVITKIKNNQSFLGIEPLNFIYGFNITTSGNVGDTVSNGYTSVINYKSIAKQINEGDMFIVSGTGGSNPRLYAFLDKDEKIILNAKVNLTATDLFLIAPVGAKKIIINSSTDDVCYQVTNFKNVKNTVYHSDAYPYGTIKTGVNIGDVVNIDTVEQTTNFKHIVIPCSPQQKIFIHGTGGLNPRLYAFLDINNKLVSVQNENEAYKKQTKVIVAPNNATKLVLNVNVQNGKNGYISLNESVINNYQLDDNAKSVRLPLVQETYEQEVSSYLNGIQLSDQIMKPIADFAMSGDYMTHVSSFAMINNVVYMAFYVNKIRYSENPEEHTAVFRYANMNDLTTITNVELLDIGNVYDNKTVTAIYDTVVLKKEDDDNVLYLVFTARLNNEYYLLYRTFTISTNTLSPINKCKFTVGNVTNDFSISGMKTGLNANNIEYKEFSSDVSFMQKLSTRIENGVTYYYTGIGVLDFCFIAKSKDLINWEYVSQPTFNHLAKYEPAVYVKGDYVYYLCREDFSSSYAFLAKYDLIKNTWSVPVNIPDCQSRSMFFENNGGIYFVHAPKDRNHIAIGLVNETNLDQSHDISNAWVDDIFYPYVLKSGDKLYLSATKSRKQIYLSEISLPQITTAAIMSKMKEIFL